MPNTLSVFRSEDKYFLSRLDAASLQRKLDSILLRDAFSETSSYVVRSLYFDSLNSLDLMTKYAGVEERKKIRIRTYDPKKRRCKLEVKGKRGALSQKTSLWITKYEATALCNGDFSVLFRYFNTSKDAVQIYHNMVMGCYRPAALVEYDRLAYYYPSFDTRVTFDMNIRGSESCFSLFDPNPNYVPALWEDTILEVKYNGRLMEHISSILKPYHLVQASASKYCYCRPLFTDFLF